MRAGWLIAYRSALVAGGFGLAISYFTLPPSMATDREVGYQASIIASNSKSRSVSLLREGGREYALPCVSAQRLCSAAQQRPGLQVQTWFQPRGPLLAREWLTRVEWEGQELVTVPEQEAEYRQAMHANAILVLFALAAGAVFYVYPPRLLSRDA